MTLIKIEVVAIVLMVLAVIMTDAEANEGFYLMVGAGLNDSSWNTEFAWENNDEVGTDAGFGYRYNASGTITLDISFKHKSQLMSGRPFNNDNESGVESYYIDLYWFPFQ